jgi:hypothetical protein
LSLKIEVHIGNVGGQRRSCTEGGLSTMFYPHTIRKPFVPYPYSKSSPPTCTRFASRLVGHEAHSLGNWPRRSVRYDYGAVCVAGHVAATLVILMGVQAKAACGSPAGFEASLQYRISARSLVLPPLHLLTRMVSVILMYVDCYKQGSWETYTSQYAAHFTTEQTEPAPPGEVNYNT